MVDIRNQLARNPAVPQVNRSVSNFAVVHWPGPAVTKPDVTQIKEYANYHVYTHSWDGLAYHYVIGRDNVYQTRDWNARLYHSGNELMNQEAFAVLVLSGQGNMLPEYQIHWLEERLRLIEVGRRYVLGHQESPRDTDCPGPLLMQWISHYRSTVVQDTVTNTTYNANVRESANVGATKLGVISANTKLTGKWVLGKPVKGDCLWLKIDRGYVHATALNTSSYRPIY